MSTEKPNAALEVMLRDHNDELFKTVIDFVHSLGVGRRTDGSLQIRPASKGNGPSDLGGARHPEEVHRPAA